MISVSDQRWSKLISCWESENSASSGAKEKLRTSPVPHRVFAILIFLLKPRCIRSDHCFGEYMDSDKKVNYYII